MVSFVFDLNDCSAVRKEEGCVTATYIRLHKADTNAIRSKNAGATSLKNLDVDAPPQILRSRKRDSWLGQRSMSYKQAYVIAVYRTYTRLKIYPVPYLPYSYVLCIGIMENVMSARDQRAPSRTRFTSGERCDARADIMHQA